MSLRTVEMALATPGFDAHGHPRRIPLGVGDRTVAPDEDVGVEPMLVSPTRAESMEPLLRSTTAATPTMAQSCERRLNFL